MIECRYYRYRLRHSHTVALPGSRLLRLAVRVFYERLKRISEGTLVAGQRRCFFPSGHNIWCSVLLTFHQLIGSIISSYWDNKWCLLIPWVVTNNAWSVSLEMPIGLTSIITPSTSSFLSPCSYQLLLDVARHAEAVVSLTAYSSSLSTEIKWSHTASPLSWIIHFSFFYLGSKQVAAFTNILDDNPFLIF